MTSVTPSTADQAMNGVSDAVLDVRDLRVSYRIREGKVSAVNGVSFSLGRKEVLGLVGESGSGKSTIALSLLRLIKPPGTIEQGTVVLNGRNLLTLPEEEMRLVRLAELSMVAQGAMNSLNPVMRVREQIVDAWRDHDVDLRKGATDERITDLMVRVGLRPEDARRYPHELSGGMKQRAVIAIAISLRPSVIIADEPTSALDVVVQRQIFDTLEQVQDEIDASVILIGHDMGLMAQSVDRLGVMYAGEIVELSPVRDVFKDPLHPYSRLLIASLPSLDQRGGQRGIPGMPPSLLKRPPGCPFQPRCPMATAICTSEAPRLLPKRPNRLVACHHVDAQL
ncbi:MAG: ABC transporter ATP-binding protein [Thermomicrobiales bacterium]